MGYFQLSRFKFVDATATDAGHLDLASEQKILKVPVNRGACCHVAGDIDFDSDNNLWLVTGDDTPAGGGNSGGFAPFNDMLTATGLFNAPHVDARRSALNTNDLRGKILRITGRASRPTEATLGLHGPGAATCSRRRGGGGKTRPEIYAMGFRNPFRITVDENDVAYITDYSPDSQTSRELPRPGRHRPDDDRARAGELRLAVVLPAPTCRTTAGTSTSAPARRPAAGARVRQPGPGPRTPRAGTSRAGPRSPPERPPITNPEMWYSYPTRTAGTTRSGHAVLRVLQRLGHDDLPAALPRAAGRVASDRTGAAKYDSTGQPRPDQAPAVLRRGDLLRRVHPRLPCVRSGSTADGGSSRSTTC